MELRTGGPFLLGDDGGTGPVIARHGDGSFVVVWKRRPYDSNYDIIEAQRFDDVGSPNGGRFAVSTFGSSRPRYPDVASLGSGRFVVVWSTYDFNAVEDLSREVYGRIFNGDGTPAGIDFHVNTFTATRQQRPKVDAAADGSFVVVWESGGNDTYAGDQFSGPDGHYLAVAARRFDNTGVGIGDEFVVNTFTPYSESNPDVGVRADGSFVVVWDTQYGDERPGGPYGTIIDNSVTMRLYQANGDPVGDEEHINDFKPGNQVRPAIALDDDGGFVVVWESYSTYASADPRDSDSGVFGRAFDSNGTPEGGDFHVNSFSAYDQSSSSVAGDGNGSFVVVWTGAEAFHDYGADFSSGIAGRVFKRGTAGSGDFPITISKDDGLHEWGVDPLIPYTISVTNNDGLFHDVTITERVPVKSTFSPAGSTPGWTCAAKQSGRTECTMDLGSVPPGATVDVDFAVLMDPGAPQLWTAYNVAFATAGDIEGVAIAEQATPFGGCELVDLDPGVCMALCYYLPAFCSEVNGVSVAGARIAPGEEPLAFLRFRDVELGGQRGGERLTDLYYQNNVAIVAATESDPGLVSLGTTAFTTLALSPSSVLTQGQVDALNNYLAALTAAADPELAGVLTREWSRLDIDGLVGKSIDTVRDELDHLSCEGFETELLCGDVTGDCAVTATDALAILRIAVKLDPDRPEADMDGVDGVIARDALQALRFAVGIHEPEPACNTPPP